MSCPQCQATNHEDWIEGVCCLEYTCGLCDWRWVGGEPCDYHKGGEEE